MEDEDDLHRLIIHFEDGEYEKILERLGPEEDAEEWVKGVLMESFAKLIREEKNKKSQTLQKNIFDRLIDTLNWIKNKMKGK